jgi:hypothetical protein
MMSQTLCTGLLFGVVIGTICSVPICYAQSTNPLEPVVVTYADIARDDLSDWRAAETTNTREAYTTYLTRHPQGWFKPVAQARTEPGLGPEIGPRPQFENAILTDEQARMILNWEAKVWQSAQSVGTHAAMRDYLLTVPMGAHVDEAVRVLMQTFPRLGQGVPRDCTQADLAPKKVRAFNVERAYPQRAVVREIEEDVVGEVLIDYTGQPLAWVDVVYTQPELFSRPVRRTALQMRYEPTKAGCIDAPTYAHLNISFRLEDDEAPTIETQRIPAAIDAEISLGQRSPLYVPSDRSLKLRIPHTGYYSVYKVQATGGFPVVFGYSRNGRNWAPLLNGTHYVARGPEPVFVSVSGKSEVIRDSEGNPTGLRYPYGTVQIEVNRTATRGEPKSTQQRVLPTPAQ